MVQKFDQQRHDALLSDPSRRPQCVAEVAAYAASAWAEELVPAAVEHTEVSLLRLVEATLLAAMPGQKAQIRHVLRDVRQARRQTTCPAIALGDPAILHAHEHGMVLFSTRADLGSVGAQYGASAPRESWIVDLLLSAKVERQVVRTLVRNQTTGLIAEVRDSLVIP